jgi:hypothetical protein
MDNFALRRTDAAQLLAQTQMNWFGLLKSRTEGMSASELVERHLYGKAPLFGKPRPFPNVAYRRQP